MRIGSITLLLLAISQVAAAEPRRLTLQQAVEVAMHVEPLMQEAHAQDARARLGVLRAQLDRFSLKGDGSVQELWNKANIGGAPISYACLDSTGMATAIPPEFCNGIPGLLPSQGTVAPYGDQSPSQWQGLSNFQASLNYYLFSGFRVEANVARAKLQERAATVQTT